MNEVSDFAEKYKRWIKACEDAGIGEACAEARRKFKEMGIDKIVQENGKTTIFVNDTFIKNLKWHQRLRVYAHGWFVRVFMPWKTHR